MANPSIPPERIQDEVRRALAATLRLDIAKVDLDASVMSRPRG